MTIQVSKNVSCFINRNITEILEIIASLLIIVLDIQTVFLLILYSAEREKNTLITTKQE